MQPDDLFETVDTRHGRVTFFANDTGAISQSLRLYGEWAENELSFMLKMVRPGDTVIDVGGYIGTHALAFARHVGEHGQVISIEAQARSFELLARNIRSNDLGQVRLEHAIASSTSKEERIPSIDIASPGSYGSASLRDVFVQEQGQQSIAGARGLDVKAVAIDDLPLTSCALIKIDVEGMEDMVLHGAGNVIRRLTPSIYAECNTLEDGLRCFNLLKRYGYRVRAHVVLAFNEDNFRCSAENIFMGAREVALVGTAKTADPLDGYQPRGCELLLDIETADDLALALLNKPQYEYEVLRDGAAAKSGGIAALDEIAAVRERLKHCEARIVVSKEENMSLRDELARTLESMHAARAAEAALRGTVEEIMQSTSWRVTAPLRALSKKIN